MSQPAITLAGVGKCFGRQWALRDVDLDMSPGECVGLVGHNGAGKSTLIKLVLGLLRPDAGQVRVLGQNPAGGHVEIRQALGYLPENVALHPSLTGEETLAFYARLKRQDPRRCRVLLDRVGLGEASRRRVGTYSKGMRQRLGLAQALLGTPKALLLDEPTSGLDPALRQSFYEILRDLRGDGAAILLSSHALAELAGEVDRVVVMNRGRKMADGDLQVLRHLAGIQPRLRVRLPGAAALAGWDCLPGGVLQRVCAEADILPLLRSLPSAASEVEILRPNLDEIYAAFLRHDDKAGAASGAAGGADGDISGRPALLPPAPGVVVGGEAESVRAEPAGQPDAASRRDEFTALGSGSVPTVARGAAIAATGGRVKPAHDGGGSASRPAQPGHDDGGTAARCAQPGHDGGATALPGAMAQLQEAIP